MIISNLDYLKDELAIVQGGATANAWGLARALGFNPITTTTVQTAASVTPIPFGVSKTSSATSTGSASTTGGPGQVFVSGGVSGSL